MGLSAQSVTRPLAKLMLAHTVDLDIKCAQFVMCIENLRCGYFSQPSS